MAKHLVIVESPAKAKTIGKFLGRDYTVKASMGHVKDLPKTKLGVDIENDFEPEYKAIPGKGKVLTELRKAAKAVDDVLIASDNDREGEAIGWHLREALKKANPNFKRIVFNEITKKAIRESIKNPREIDQNSVDAQQARRILDRLVGYKLSPLLWDKVRRGLSAGRVQSVAVRLVVEREVEVRAFVAVEYWSIDSQLEKADHPPFEASLWKIDGDKIKISTEAEAQAVLDALQGAAFTVSDVQKKRVRRRPYAPFITSTLQQEAGRKLRFRTGRTMRIAQQLYEGVTIDGETVGLITYMRTDSRRIAAEAQEDALAYIRQEYGDDYAPEKPNFYKNKKAAQDAHEAIRPTSMAYSPDKLATLLDKDQMRLYQLIWNRFLSSQMTPAQIDQTSVEIAAGDAHLFKTSGSVVAFPGFLKVYVQEDEDTGRSDAPDKSLPPFEAGDALTVRSITPNQHFTKPPARYSESSLVRALEELGIGRPSTYATIVDTVQARKYVERDEGRLQPTELGELVNGLLVESFPDILSVDFTAQMEARLDSVEEGDVAWRDLVREFYTPFEKDLLRAEKEMRNLKTEVVETDEVCEKCGSTMVVKFGRFGKFLACSAYPECKSTKPIKSIGPDGKVEIEEPELSDELCPSCSTQMIVKRGRFGRFLACQRYPDCKTTLPLRIGVPCPEKKCSGDLVEKRSKRGRTFYGCSKYPDCTFAVWQRPEPRRCPGCDFPFMTIRYSRDGASKLKCPQKVCGYTEDAA